MFGLAKLCYPLVSSTLFLRAAQGGLSASLPRLLVLSATVTRKDEKLS